jgi:hypothetical protein
VGGDTSFDHETLGGHVTFDAFSAVLKEPIG